VLDLHNVQRTSAKGLLSVVFAQHAGGEYRETILDQPFLDMFGVRWAPETPALHPRRHAAATVGCAVSATVAAALAFERCANEVTRG
jgi:hypothetical protein